MSVCRILLADRDVEYGRAFARAVSNIHSEFEITMFQLERYNQRKKAGSIDYSSYDLILVGGCSDEMLEAIRTELANDKRIVVLTDYHVRSLMKQSEEEQNPFWYLFKYTEVNLIISDLNFLMGSLTGKISLLKKNTAPEFIGFYSISGGTGKTVIALGASRELSRHHDRKILYLSFEDMPATELFISSHPQNRNLGDYFYFLFEKKNEAVCSRLDSFTVSDEYGVETFCPTGGRNDMNELTQEELIQFLKVISDSCRYDFVILDLKNELSDQTLFLLGLCRKIILIQNDDPVSRFKTHQLTTFMNTPALEKIRERFVLITNNTAGTEPENEEIEKESVPHQKRIRIEKDDNSFQTVRNHLDIDITRTFGTGIAKVAEEIVSSGKE